MISNPLEHQTQPTGMTCVCTCLAMLCGRPASDLIELYHHSYYNAKTLDLADILVMEGFKFTREMAGQVKTMLPGAVYLLTVPSLNIKGGLHQILVDYRDPERPQVLDPAKGYAGRMYYTVDSIEADEEDNAFLLFSWIVDYTITDRS